MRLAVAILGANTVRGIVLAAELSAAFASHPLPPGVMDAHRAHSFAVATLATGILEVDEARPHVFSAGILHDIGELVLWSHMGGAMAQVVAEAERSGRSQPDVERERWGTTHAELGAYLLGLWGLPEPILGAVAHHHSPWLAAAEGVDLVAAIGVADRLLRHAQDPFADVDHAWAERLDLELNLPAWEERLRALRSPLLG